MKLDEAKAECERWFAYNQRQKERAEAFAKIASQVRSGELSSDEGRRKQRSIDGCSVTVFDGARLEQAVKLLLKHVMSGNQ